MSENAAEKPLYPVEVAELLLTATEPVNQLFQVISSLLHIVPNLHAPFARLVEGTDAETFKAHLRDVANYASAAYGPLRQAIDLMCKCSDKLIPSSQIPQLKLSLQENQPHVR